MMARFYLTIYVALHLFLIGLNVIVNFFSEETIHALTKDDWLIFIIACGALAICETLDKKQKGESQ